MPISNPFTRALMTEAKRKKWGGEEIERVKTFLDKTAWVESKGDAKAVQSSGGPGRGKYQFELGASVKSAKNRIASWEKSRKTTLPLSQADRDELDKPNADFSKLSEEAQDAIALINYTMKPKGDVMTDVAKGVADEAEVWAKYHWAGDAAEKDKKLKQWAREMLDRDRLIAPPPPPPPPAVQPQGGFAPSPI